MVDPGFPFGPVDPLGGVDLRRGCLLVKMYAKTKELGPGNDLVSYELHDAIIQT